MTFELAHAPHLRCTDRASMLSMDVLITLIPLCVFSAVYYGMRPVLLVLTGILSAVICEMVCCLLMKRKITIFDGTAAVTGGLVGALMSPMAPYWMPITGAAFAIIVVKMPMGGNGRNLFNPAAAGIAILTLCFPGFLFEYPSIGIDSPLPLTGLVTVNTQASPAAQLMSGGQTLYTKTMMLLGNFPGPIGATAIAVLIACAMYLFFRRSASILITLPYLAACAGMAVAFPRVTGGESGSVMVELCSGYLLFCGIFLLNDPVTAPKHWLGRIVYGVLAGILVMLLRYSGIGRYEEGACFAVLLVNAFSPIIDRLCWSVLNIGRRKRGENAA